MHVVALFVLATMVPLVPFLVWLSRRGQDACASDIADIMEAFLDGTAGRHDWDDFISVRLSDPVLEAIRGRCAQLPTECPAERPGQYCSEAGTQVVRAYVSQLRNLPSGSEKR